MQFGKVRREFLEKVAQLSKSQAGSIFLMTRAPTESLKLLAALRRHPRKRRLPTHEANHRNISSVFSGL